MKVAVLFSGGKDSNYAMYLASKYHEISCLINLKSKNQNSYMFQSAGSNLLELQAESLNIPLLQHPTKGEKEEELKDLKKAIKKAKDKYKIKGLVTGAIKSAYQSSRIQKICLELSIECFNPLWQINEKNFLEELIKDKFETILVGIFAYPLDKSYLGKTLNKQLLAKLQTLSPIPSIIGEGGEYESFVINSPMFKKRLNITKSEKIMDGENSGVLEIKEVNLE